MIEFRGSLDARRPLAEIDLRSFADPSDLWQDVPNWTVNLDDDHVDVFRRLVANAGFAELGTVVDIGSGYGRLAIYLAERNNRVIGIDRNRGGVAIGNQLAKYLGLSAGLRFVQADALAVPLPAAACDGVWFFSALQFMNRAAGLREAHRLLKPDGLLFLGRYNTTWVIVEKYLFGYGTDRGRESNQCDWSRRALTGGPIADGGANWLDGSSATEVMARHGFAVDELYGPQVTPPWSPRLEASEAALFRDPRALIGRLDSDDSFVEYLIEHSPRLALGVPGDMQLVARRIGPSVEHPTVEK